jgi:putative DeoR family transcriptional regulator (stage III sporulation protein D)
MKTYIEERAIEIASYIIENNATVRQTAKTFDICKSTVLIEGRIWNGLFG